MFTKSASGADLLKQELNIKSIVDSVSTFDSSSLRSATTEEKVLLPDAETIQTERDRVNLLRSLEGEHVLSPVENIKEPVSGVELLQQELTRQKVLENVEAFDFHGLKHNDVNEKIVLPDEATIQKEKAHVQHLADIGAFDQSNLTHVKVIEPLSGQELATQENIRGSITSELAAFDISELKGVPEIREASSIPSFEDIQAEQQHLDHMKHLEAGIELRKTETREPASPLDLAKFEMHKHEVEDEVQSFDRSKLTPVETEEKLWLPNADELQDLPPSAEPAPKGASGLRDFLLEDETRENRSSSEEWEKVDGGDSEC